MLVGTDVCVQMVFVWEETGVPGGTPPSVWLGDHMTIKDPYLFTRMTHTASGRVLDVYSTEPGVQFYTGYYLNTANGKGGANYPQFSAFCFEAQHYPDSPNQVGSNLRSWPYIESWYSGSNLRSSTYIPTNTVPKCRSFT